MTKKDSKIHIATEDEVAQYGGQPVETPQSDAAADPPAGVDQHESNSESTGKDGVESSSGEETAQQELEETKDKLLRAKAEIQNLLRRTAIEKSEAIRFANEDLVKGLLPVVDDFERTLTAADQAEGAESIVQGVRLVYDKLLKVLRDNQVTPIEAEGQAFDPAYHSAAMRQPSAEAEPGTVLQVVQKGYMLRDRVIRPAQVVIAAPADGAPDTSDAGPQQTD